jgi:hypothetical protein
MKRQLLFVTLISVFLLSSLTGCRSIKTTRKPTVETADVYQELLSSLAAEPSVTELTARVSFNLSGRKATGQIRMRRDRSVQIGVSVLGLLEVARVEFLPDKVVVMDRTSNRYAVCHYADLPLRNELGLDFNVIQAILWNRIFSPGVSADEMLSNIVLNETKALDGSPILRDRGYGYLFTVDRNNRLSITSNTVAGRGISVGYSDFKTVSKGFDYPMTFYVQIAAANAVSATLSFSSVSTEKGSWPDETGITSRMERVSIEELVESLEL